VGGNPDQETKEGDSRDPDGDHGTIPEAVREQSCRELAETVHDVEGRHEDPGFRVIERKTVPYEREERGDEGGHQVMAQVSRHEEREKYEKDGPAGRLADDGAPASEGKKRIIEAEG
jgi:hypothetical protein